MRIKKGYKVVRPLQGKHWSSFPSLCKEASIIYKKKGFNRPKEGFGPLAVFYNEKCAIKFAKVWKCYELRIFKCFYKKSEKVYLSNNWNTAYMDSLPAGTDFADWVKLRKEIKSGR